MMVGDHGGGEKRRDSRDSLQAEVAGIGWD